MKWNIPSMMRIKKINLRLLLIPVLLISIYSTMFFIAGKGAQFPMLYGAITADLLLIAPLVYLGLIWKTSIPKISVIPVLLFGLVFGYTILPKHGYLFLDLFKEFVLPFIELSALTFVGIKLFKLHKKTKALSDSKLDIYDSLKIATAESFPGKTGLFFTVEIATLYYAFFRWKKAEREGFSYHQKSTTVSLFIAIVLILIAESFTLHYFASKASPIFAWILTLISLYTLVQFIGWGKSLADRPHQLKNDVLHLRFGIARSADIPVESIQLVTHSEKEHENARSLSLLGKLDPHNMYVQTDEHCTIETLYGFKTRTKELVFFADAPDALIEAILAAKTEKNERH